MFFGLLFKYPPPITMFLIRIEVFGLFVSFSFVYMTVRYEFSFEKSSVIATWIVILVWCLSLLVVKFLITSWDRLNIGVSFAVSNLFSYERSINIFSKLLEDFFFFFFDFRKDNYLYLM